MSDLSGRNIVSLETMLENYRRVGKTADPMYLALTDEIGKRKSPEFDIERTVSFIRHNGRLRRFVSYKELADHYGVRWVAARRPMAPHLDAVCAHAAARGWPMLSAIVVSKENLGTGELDAASLEGFMKTAIRLGLDRPDRLVFLKEQQQAVFAWAQRDADE